MENGIPNPGRAPTEGDLITLCRARVSDEILVDLIIAACGKSMTVASIGGVEIPFATPQLMLRMKQTHREKDADDRVFLQRRIAQGDNE